MKLALKLAEQARLHAPPNPWVGCVIVKDNQVVGQGYTQPAGQSHAEICALQEAKERAKGASLFVTLEPCPHHGRTPPCTETIIQAGIKHVYIGLEDPDERVRGKGIECLKNAGISVTTGVYKEKIEQSLQPYIYHRHSGLPYTILKTAISIDGRTTAADGSSQWITCEKSREDVHLQRALSQAILIGTETAIKDSPLLTVRHPTLSTKIQPLRILLDSKGRVPPTGPLFDQTLAPTLIITTDQANKTRIQEWKAKGVEVQLVNASPEGVNLLETWRLIGARSILQLLIEGGSRLHTSLLKTSLYNELLVYIGPLLIGCTGQPAFLHHINHLKEAQRLTLQHVQQMGQSIRILYRPNHSINNKKLFK